MQNQFKTNITIIGSGNTATCLGNLFLKAGHHIDAIFSRNPVNANALADKCSTITIASLEEIPTSSKFIILAVSDDAIGEVVHKIPQIDSILLHTAGSVSKNILTSGSNRFGVLYPLQTLRMERSLNEKLPILIDGNDEEVIHLVNQLACSITDLVHIAGDEERFKLHLSAVFVSNFTNHLYQLTYEWCEQSQLPFSLLLPIIREMAGRQSDVAPAQWQTGPASRGDRETLKKHLDLLKDYPMMQKVYELMSEDLLARKQKNDDLRNINHHE